MSFDEPVSALEPEMINEVLDVMTVTHEGRVVEDAITEEFFGNPRRERARDFLSKILHHRTGIGTARLETANSVLRSELT